jgi:hypothetical protein
MDNNIEEPTFTELRHEAIASIHKLLKSNNGVIEQGSVLHLGMFLAILDGKTSQPVESLEIAERHYIAERYYKKGHDILNRLEGQAEDYGDQRMVQLSNEDLATLRNALIELRGAR